MAKKQPVDPVKVVAVSTLALSNVVKPKQINEHL